MQIRLTKTRDLVGPQLAKALRGVRDKAPYHRIMGETAVQLSKGAFNNPTLRPAPWSPLSSGAPARLRRNNVLARSPRTLSYDQRRAIIGSDRKYAAIHQLGGTTAPHVIRPKNKKALAWPGGPGPRRSVRHPGSRIPARPYFPFVGRRPSPTLRRYLRSALGARLARDFGRRA